MTSNKDCTMRRVVRALIVCACAAVLYQSPAQAARGDEGADALSAEVEALKAGAVDLLDNDVLLFDKAGIILVNEQLQDKK